jgi:SAM-dependent methyltransferase
MTKSNPSEALADFRSVWNAKPVLRLIYSDIFDRIVRECGPGPTLEIGGGIGNFKERMPDVLSSDIQFSDQIDLVVDGQRLPFVNESLGNIVMVDVIHHLEFPVRLLREASRALRIGGRIVMVEPAITFGSSLFYRCLHREPVDMTANPLIEGEPDPHRDPYASNQAIPTLLATKYRGALQKVLPQLRLSAVQWFSLFAYPLSGGFQRWSLLSPGMARWGLALERSVEIKLGRAFGFRMLIRFDRVG